MNLIFYSGGTGRENKHLAEATAQMLSGKLNPRVTFVPVHGEDAAVEYRAFMKRFTAFGLNNFNCIALDEKWTKKMEQDLLSSDAIFLGGGNTFYFLKHIRERGLIPKLRSFVKRGGLLLGLSAGSILMTPSIQTAAVPSMDSDDNEVDLQEWNALGLVPFEFSPHYYSSRSADKELMEYSKTISHPVYACADGQGIVVQGKEIRFVGRVTVFHNGLKYTVH